MGLTNVTQPTAEPGGDSTIVEGASESTTPASELARGATIGRYVVLDRVGAGGMGVVYAAYDPELDRKVAVKVLHRVGQSESAQNVARARLLREAQALARLPHPNVVTIHDVGTFAERAWIAMEFVTGQTMTAWLRAEPRSWSTVLDVLLAAGDGVAAAHAAELLHRDLKPDNIMIDETGRVRVMDFGLARGRDLDATERSLSESKPSSLVNSGTMLALDVTRAGSLIGTPAYMAPEQLGATGATVASDQYSYCVTLWEALFGVRPFGGDTVHSQLAAMLDGVPQRGNRRAPAWLRRILERGLSTDPRARHRSMASLLRALRSGRQRARRRNLAIAGLGVTVVAAGAWGIGEARRRAAIGACDDRAAAIDAQWPARATEIDAAIRSTGLAYAGATAEHLPGWLDRFAARWSETTASTCRAAEVDASMEEASYRRARACLESHAVTLTALLDAVADGTPGAIQGVVSAAARLPDPTECADMRALTATPWSEEVDQREVAELRARFARADAMDVGGRSEGALALDDESLARAIELGWAPLVAEARMRRGGRLSVLTRLDDAEQTLREAYFEALRAGAQPVAARAAMWLVRTVGYQMGHHDDGLLWGEHALAVLDRMGTPAELDRASLDAMNSAVHRERGALDQARRLEESVLAVREEILGDRHPAVADSHEAIGNTLLLLGDDVGAAAAHRRSLAIREAVFGVDHPMIAASLNNLANAVGDEEGEQLLLRAVQIGEAVYGRDSYAVSVALSNLGGAYVGLDRLEEARALYARVIAIEERVLGPDHQEVAGSYANMGGALLQLGEVDEAARHYERAMAIAKLRLDADHPMMAQLHHNIGLTHAERGELAAAEVSYREAKSTFRKERGAPEWFTNALELGSVLRRLGRLDEADLELSEAREHHQALAEPFAWFLPDLAYEQGQIHVARGEHERALELYERAVAKVESNTLVAARLGFAIAMSRIALEGPSTEQLASARAGYADLVRHLASKYELGEAAARLDAVLGPQSRRR